MSNNKFAGLFSDSDDDDVATAKVENNTAQSKNSSDKNTKGKKKTVGRRDNRGGNRGSDKTYNSGIRDGKSQRRNDNDKSRKNKQRSDRRGGGKSGDRRSRNTHRENRGGRDGKRGGHGGWGTDGDVIRGAYEGDERNVAEPVEEEEEEDTGITFEEYQKSLKAQKKPKDLFGAREIRSVESKFEGMSIVKKETAAPQTASRKKKSGKKKKVKKTVESGFGGQHDQRRGARDSRGGRKDGRRGKRAPDMRSETDFPTLG